MMPSAQRSALRFLVALTILLLPFAACRGDELHAQLVSALETMTARMEEAPQKIEAYTPAVPGLLSHLDNDTAALLKGLPYVAEVRTVVRREAPKRRVIVFANAHFVERSLFVQDVEHHRGRKLSPRESVLEYWRLLAVVETIQWEQMAAIHCLCRRHGLKEAFEEGLTTGRSAEREIAGVARDVRAEAGADREFPQQTREHLKALTLRREPTVSECESMLKTYSDRFATLQAGTLFRLHHQKILPRVVPCEDERRFEAAAPRFREGEPVFDTTAVEAREDAIVASLLRGGPTPVVVLGAAHDLSDNLQRLAPDADLIVVRVQSVPRVGK
jgi:hypothetical protein